MSLCYSQMSKIFHLLILYFYARELNTGKKKYNLLILLEQEKERWIVGQNLEDKESTYCACLLAGTFVLQYFLLGTKLV